MLFNSFPFVVLLLATFTLYYLPPLRRVQIPLLIAASFTFYAYQNAPLLLLLLASIGINAISSFRVMRTESRTQQRAWAVIGVAANLLVLAFFKYGGLIGRSLHFETAESGSFGHWLVTLPLPIGISFFTFQGISLVVDVFRERSSGRVSVKSTSWWRHLLNTSFFKAFFPQLIAGPIVKAHDFYPQIGPKKLRDLPWERAVCALIAGYFLKMVIADNLKDLTFWMSAPYFRAQSSMTLLTLLLGYSAQIFADFAGYSLIAIGLARLFGYELMQNFNFPYISQSLSEFWRRWHISLSTWLREYLYIPLGGNRHGEARTYLNLFIVMTLGGLWHGTSWSYAVWGMYHGLGLAAERFFGWARADDGTRFRPWRAAAVFIFVTLGWLLFKLPKFDEAVDFVRALASNWNMTSDIRLDAYLLFYTAAVVLWHLWALFSPRIKAWWKTPLHSIGYATALVAIVVNSGSPGQFIYFQF